MTLRAPLSLPGRAEVCHLAAAYRGLHALGMLASGSPGLNRTKGLGLRLDSIADLMDMNFGQTLEASEGQGGLACCSPWGRKESDTTEQLNGSQREEFHP